MRKNLNQTNQQVKFIVNFLVIGLGLLLSGNAKAQYSGTLTVGGLSPDFNSVEEAFDSLETHGVNGNVRIQIRQGKYRERITVDHIPGVDSNNQVTVAPDPANTDSVILHNKVYGLLSNYVVIIRQSYVNFDSLFFRMDSAELYNLMSIIYITDTVGIHRINACTFIGLPVDYSNYSGTFTNLILILHRSHLARTGITITGCKFLYGRTSINRAANRLSAPLPENSYFHVENNEFLDFGFEGVVDHKGKGGVTKVINNIFIDQIYDNKPVKANSFAIRINATTKARCEILSNYISTRTKSTNYLIYVALMSSGDSTKRSKIVNNILDAQGDHSINLSLYRCNYFDIAHNTFLNRSRFDNGFCVELRDTNRGTRFVNNNLKMYETGQPFTFTSLDGFYSDYNNYYSEQRDYFRKMFDDSLFNLAEFQAKYGLERNSSAKISLYSSGGIPRTKSATLNNKGTYTGTKNDFWANGRDTTRPDIGAEEFTPFANDLVLLKLITPDEACGTDSFSLGAVVFNNGSASQDSFMIAYDLTGQDTGKATYVHSSTLASGQTDTIQFVKVPQFRSGKYNLTVQVILPGDEEAGNDTIRVPGFTISAARPELILKNDTICYGEMTTFGSSIQGAVVYWYDPAVSADYIHRGNTFTTPKLYADKTYYYQVSDTTHHYAGERNYAPTSGYIQADGSPYGLTFAVYKTIVFDSATVYPQGTGTMTVLIWDKNGILKFKSDPIAISGTNFQTPNRIPIGFELQPGQYIIGLSVAGGVGTMGRENQYYNKNTYPLYSSDSTVEIIGSSGAPSSSFYYWYYDWKLLRNACHSNLDSVQVVQSRTKFALPPDTSYCSAEGISMVLEPKGDYYDFNWNTGDTGRSIQVDSGGYYEVTARDRFNCMKRTQITITELPSPSVNLGPDLGYCPENTLNKNLDAGVHKTYLWHDGKASRYYLADTAGIYHVDVSAQNGCRNSDTVVVEVYPSPEVALPGDTAFCDNTDSVYLLDAGPGFASYQWFPLSSASRYLEISQTARYTVNVTNEYGCFDSDNIYVAFHAVEKIDLGADTAICDNESIDLTLKTGTMWRSYRWNTGDSASELVVKQYGRYDLTATDSNGCIESDTIDVIEIDAPSFSLPGDTLVHPDSVLKILIRHNYTGTPKSLLWNTGAKSDSILATDTGLYSLTITGMNGCSRTESMHIGYLQTGKVSDQRFDGLKIYPNPVTGMVHITNLSHPGCSVTVYANTGELVMEKEMKDIAISLDLSHLGPGPYMIVLWHDGSIYSKKIIKL